MTFSEKHIFHQCYDCEITFLSLHSWKSHFDLVHINERYKHKNVIVHYKVDEIFIEKDSTGYSSKETAVSLPNRVENPQENVIGKDPKTPFVAHVTSRSSDEIPDDGIENVVVVVSTSNKYDKITTRQTKKRTTEESDDCDKTKSNTKIPRFSRNVSNIYKLQRDKTYKCNLCEDEFDTSKELVSHLSEFHSEDEGLLKCKICSKIFLQPVNLYMHMRCHSDLNPFQCQDCDEAFSDYRSLKIHRKNRHIPQKTFKCSLCPKSFETRTLLKEHMISHRGEKHYECRICLKTFSNRNCLKSHFLCHTASNTFMCEMCGKCFPVKTKLNVHIRTYHIDSQPQQCKICHKKYANARNLKCHMIFHQENKPFKCTICDKSFVKNAFLKNHMETHSAKSHQCSFCGNLYSQSSHLNRHIRNVHTKEPPHPRRSFNKSTKKNPMCNVCHRLFKGMERLKEHMDSHSKEYPHQCDICFKRYKNEAMFNQHTPLHLGRRPHPCSMCDMGFGRRINLELHMADEHNVKCHPCDFCSKSFRQKGQLIDHLRTHTGEKPHQCSICQKQFSQKTHVNRHMKLMHHVESNRNTK